jgi:hypothetical protein
MSHSIYLLLVILRDKLFFLSDFEPLVKILNQRYFLHFDFFYLT